ncbi:MAG: alanine racemase [Candidatus Acidiferrales bacterium]
MAPRIRFDGRPIWAEVSLGALAHNLRAIRRYVNAPGAPVVVAGSRGERALAKSRNPRKVLAVVKGDGYGHGAAPVARALERAGADWFGVTCAAEGADLRYAGVRAPILVMTGFWTGEEKSLLENKLTPAVTGLETLRWLERAAARRRRGPVGFHLKVDSGMNRLGVSPEEVPAFARALADSPHLRLDGVFTHFASSDVLTSSQTEDQTSRFIVALDRLRALGIQPGLVHMANSAAVGARPETWADMVRPGALLYGYHQFYDPPEHRARMEAKLPLRPVLSLRARSVLVRDVAVGASVGYNARWTATRPSRIAVISAGYADGLLRSLTNRMRALVRGEFAPLVGTISMDLATADVTGIDGVKPGDIATLYGADGAASQWVSEVAATIGTVSSDLLCAIGKRVPRFYVE